MAQGGAAPSQNQNFSAPLSPHPVPLSMPAFPSRPVLRNSRKKAQGFLPTAKSTPLLFPSRSCLSFPCVPAQKAYGIENRFKVMPASSIGHHSPMVDAQATSIARVNVLGLEDCCRSIIDIMAVTYRQIKNFGHHDLT